MERLVPILNKLQSVLGVVGQQGIQLPQLVVVGSQSSGKSSVLENIVGKDFLPRGNNIVTRRPLILQLHTFHRDPSNGPGHDGDEFAEFEHLPGQRITNFDFVKQEIMAETDRLAKGTNISDIPILLRIWSPYVPPLTLVDLPGITKVATGDQPQDIEQLIKHMILKFVSNPNSIIVAVSSATEDIANSEAIKLAREIDPQGSRTLGVLTKLDLMDKGTDAMDILSNRVIPLRLGYVGVINRSQHDIINRKPIRAALAAERSFFAQGPYSQISSQMGTDYLTKRLSTLLLQHLNNKLPSIKQQIYTQIQETERELETYGHPLGLDLFGAHISDTGLGSPSSAAGGGGTPGSSDTPETSGSLPQSHLGPILLELLGKFTMHYVQSLEGRSLGNSCAPPSSSSSSSSSSDGASSSLSPDDSITTVSQLYGGARIAFVFNEIFGQEISRLDPFEYLTDLEIRTAIRNATGPRPTLFLPEIAFEMLVKQQIERLRGPTLRCIDLVYEELIRVAYQCQTTAIPQLHRFPALQQAIHHTVCKVLDQRIIPCKLLISNLVNIELSFINTSHPDFIGGNRALTQLQLQRKQRKESGKADHDTDKIASEMARHLELQQKSPQSQIPIGTYTTEAIKTASSMLPTEREMIEIDVIKVLIASYYGIVKKTIRDTVPKAIMYILINKTKEDMQSQLVRELYKEDKFSILLKEADDVADKRKACYELLRILKKALEILSHIKDTNIS